MTFDSGTEDLLASVADGVLTLTLNRPAARNALSRAMLDGQSASAPSAGRYAAGATTTPTGRWDRSGYPRRPPPAGA